MSFLTHYFEKEKRKRNKGIKVKLLSFQEYFDHLAKLSPFISFLTNYFEKNEREKDRGAQFKSLSHLRVF